MKDTTEAIRNGKTISTMELSHLTASEQQEYETMAICEEQNTETFNYPEIKRSLTEDAHDIAAKEVAQMLFKNSYLQMKIQHLQIQKKQLPLKYLKLETLLQQINHPVHSHI